MGHPSDSLCVFENPEELPVEDRGLPHLAKDERDTPTFLPAPLEKTACAPFFKGKAHEAHGTHDTSQEVGGMGHPGFFAR